MKNFLVLVVTLIISLNTLAHEGHDHSYPLSGLIHLLWISPLFVGAYLTFRVLMNTDNKEQESND